MSFATAAVVFVAIAFSTLVVWVLLPSNRKRLEAHGEIPLDEGTPSDRRRRSR
jgi:hypothetical protein